MANFEALIGDITKLKIDAIVNAANTTLLGGNGVDGAIHKAAGGELLKECIALNGCKTGQAKITKGYDLPSKYIIHTVGPIWQGGNKNEKKLLRACYINTLSLAKENGIKTIAFPSISCGSYNFPMAEACSIAFYTTKYFVERDDYFDKIIFIDIKNEIVEVYRNLLKD